MSFGQNLKTLIYAEELSELTGVPLKTLYVWLRKGNLKGAAKKRGKHWLIHREEALHILLNGKKWKS